MCRKEVSKHTFGSNTKTCPTRLLQQFSGPREQIPAMKRVKSLIAEANFTDSDSNNNNSSSNSNSSNASVAGGVRVFPLSNGYTQWETDEVIAYELYRNLALAISE